MSKGDEQMTLSAIHVGRQQPAREESYCVWHYQPCMNPVKGWIMCGEKKITKLISVKTARLVVQEHNRAVAYLGTRITIREEP